MDNPITPINALIDALENATTPIGFELKQAVVIPGRDTGPDVLQVFFTLNEELVGKTAEQRAEAELLKGIEIETAKAERDRKFEEAKQRALGLAADMAGEADEDADDSASPLHLDDGGIL